MIAISFSANIFTQNISDKAYSFLFCRIMDGLPLKQKYSHLVAIYQHRQVLAVMEICYPPMRENFPFYFQLTSLPFSTSISSSYRLLEMKCLMKFKPLSSLMIICQTICLIIGMVTLCRQWTCHLLKKSSWVSFIGISNVFNMTLNVV